MTGKTEARLEEVWQEIDCYQESRFRLTLANAGFHATARDVVRALEIVCREKPINPFERWVNNLPLWDGSERLARLFTDYFGARGDAERLQKLAFVALVGAVDRALHPGAAQGYIPFCLGRMPIEPLLALFGEQDVLEYDRLNARLARPYRLALTRITGRVSEYTHFKREDYVGKHLTRRHWTVWGWAPELPKDLTDTRYIEYLTYGDPHLRHIEQDREQIWAEALHHHRKGVRPAPPLNSRNPWTDEWAGPLQALCDRHWRLGWAPRYKDILKALGERSSKGTLARVDTLMKALFSAKRQTVTGIGHYWEMHPGQKPRP